MPTGIYQRVRRVWTAERDAVVQKMYLSGMSENQIAHSFSSTRNRVAESLLRTNTPKRRKGLSGSKNPAWKGGRRIDADGYISIWCPDHPKARKHGTVLEHRLVAEKILGRFLADAEVVHHKNGDRADNRPENLQVFPNNGEHLKVDLAGRCPKWTEDGYRRLLASAKRKKDAAAKRKALGDKS